MDPTYIPEEATFDWLLVDPTDNFDDNPFELLPEDEGQFWSRQKAAQKIHDNLQLRLDGREIPGLYLAPGKPGDIANWTISCIVSSTFNNSIFSSQKLL